jgi:phosphoribosylanthranilate isomerase
VFVKICGITNEDDALLAAALGADAVGFVFAASPRRISTNIAREIVRRLPPEILTVGVFRDERKERVVEAANTAGLRAVQLHGRETPADCTWIRQRVPVTIRAFAAGDPGLERIDDYGADLTLIDSATPGSGRVFDWQVLDGAPVGRSFILAGGLDPENVADAVAAVRPWGVDVSSGVEAAPGHKDPVRLREFIRAARSVRRDGPEDDGDWPYDWQEDATWR